MISSRGPVLRFTGRRHGGGEPGGGGRTREARTGGERREPGRRGEERTGGPDGGRSDEGRRSQERPDARLSWRRVAARPGTLTGLGADQATAGGGPGARVPARGGDGGAVGVVGPAGVCSARHGPRWRGRAGGCSRGRRPGAGRGGRDPRGGGPARGAFGRSATRFTGSRARAGVPAPPPDRAPVPSAGAGGPHPAWTAPLSAETTGHRRTPSSGPPGNPRPGAGDHRTRRGPRGRGRGLR